ncbi:Stage II sporulation protein R [compost metagenome]
MTIGQGAGQNWWCVLFPALCFVDAEKGEAVAANSRTAEDKAKVEAVKKQTASVDKVKTSLSGKTAKQASAEKDTLGAQEDTGKKKVRFYLWDKVKSLFA